MNRAADDRKRVMGVLRIVGCLVLWALVEQGMLGVVYAIRHSLPADSAAEPFAEAFDLLIFGAGCAVPLLFTRFVDKRPIVNLGLQTWHWFLAWLRGALIGSILMLVVILGWLTLFAGATWSVNLQTGRAASSLLVAFVVFAVQGPSEELLFRGYILQNIAAISNMRWAVGVSALLFALVHAGNGSFSLLPFVTLFLFGVGMALYKLCVDGGRLWGVFGIHSLWNWLQEYVFGQANSGASAAGDNTLFHAHLDTTQPGWLWGGGFGPEGTAGAISVLLILIGAILLVRRHKGESAVQIEQREVAGFA